MIDFFSLLKIQGFPMKRAEAVWNEICTVEDLFPWQMHRRDELVNQVIRCNSNYERIAGTYDGVWENLPVLTKEIINGNRLTPDLDQLRGSKIFVSSTSGSSGKPFQFVKDGITHCLTWLLVNDRYKKMGVDLNDFQARFYGTPLSFYDKYFEKTKDYIGHRFRFPILDLTDTELNNWMSLFRRKTFKYIYGYSYPLIVFAKYLSRKGIVLKELCPSLKACILTAEMCNPDERILIERSFGISIANEYGTSEMGIVGFSNAFEWILSDELVYTEILDDAGNVLKNGESGNIVCTSLYNNGTPFIRYNTGDYGAVVQEGGRRYLTGLMGRKEDMVVLPSGRLAPGDTVFYYVFKDFASRFDVIQEYKVIQKERNYFEVRYVGKRDLNDKELQSLFKYCDVSLEKGLIIQPIRMEVLDRTKLGKFRRFVSEVKSEIQ